MKCWCPFGNNQKTFIKFINVFTKFDANYICTKFKGKYTSNNYPSSLLENMKKCLTKVVLVIKFFISFFKTCMKKSIQTNLEILVPIKQIG